MESARKIRVVVVEDEGLFRELTCSALAGLDDIEVVGAFGDEASALAAVPALGPQVALTDIDLGAGGSGIRLGAALKRALPELAVVLLSNHREADFLGAPETQGWSYLHKKSLGNLDALGAALRGAAAGLVVLDAGVAAGLQPQAAPALPEGDRAGALLALLAQGLSNAAIAERLCLAEKSVENQLGQLYKRLGIDTSAEGIHPRVSAALAYWRSASR